MSFRQPLRARGQLIQRIVPPDDLAGFLEATLFLRGSFMDRSAGSPEKAWKLLGGPSTGIPLIAPIQVHGTAILEEGRIWALPSRPKADGVLLDKGDCAGSLRFADCFPVLLASSFPRPWALILHAGFEGTAKGILSRSTMFIETRIGGFRPEKTFAWVGPGIGPCCYTRRKENDPKTALGLANFPAGSWEDLGKEVRFDIPKALQIELLSLGLRGESIFLHGNCTACHSGTHYSYRAGDLGARNFFVVRSGPAVHNHIPWWENI